MSRVTRKRKKKKTTRKKRAGQVTITAATADKHMLYQQSVQDPPTTVDLINKMFEYRGKPHPKSLREDFCGTALFAAHFVSRDDQHSAIGVDLDRETLDWGIENNIRPLGERANRITLYCEDVLTVDHPQKVDLTVAFNFSYWVFMERAVMKQYFQRAHASLAEGGAFILDLHGGPDAQFQLEEPIDMGEYEYVWEQSAFCPITNKTTCHIHFRFKDGSALNNAFTYEWRWWSLPELRDILVDAGFSKIDTWFDEDNGNDEYAPCTTTTNMEAFVAYLVAWK